MWCVMFMIINLLASSLTLALMLHSAVTTKACFGGKSNTTAYVYSRVAASL